MESVQVIESCLVAPREATPTKRLWLSSIDVALANVGHSPIVCLYHSGATFVDVPRLKEALAKALVPYYPLAGRLGVDDDGRAEICCNGEGALFVVARSSLTAQDVDFSKPSPVLKRMFVPSIDIEPLVLLAVQVTFLRCGAVVFGLSMQHGSAAADGIAASQFIHTWSALYRDESSAAGKELPCHDRTLLRARSPPLVHPDALPLLHYPTPLLPSNSQAPMTTVNEVFPISRDQLVTLKRLCGGGGGAGAATASTFVSLSALVWRCMSLVRRLPPDAVTRLSFAIDFRRYVRPPLPTGYFGNALLSLCATGAAADIAAEGLPSVAARIGGAMARMDDELVRSAIDIAELAIKENRPLNHSGSGDFDLLPETDLMVVSRLNMPLGLDLGCGGPQVVTRADTIRHGHVYLFDDYAGPANHRGVCIVVSMEAERINEFQRLLYASIPNQSQASKL